MFWYCLIAIVITVFVLAITFWKQILISLNDYPGSPRSDGYPHDNAQSPKTEEDYREEQEQGSWHD